jgi:hypothetical protein
MSTINFLPQSYRRRLRHRVRHVREGVTILAVIIILGVWWAYDTNGLIEMREASRFAEDRLAAALSTEQSVKELEARRIKLVDQRRLQREISVPIRHYQIIRVLGGMLPESVALTEVELVNERPKPKAYQPTTVANPEAKQPVFGSEPIVDTSRGRETDRVRVALIGLAPDDLAVAEVIASLSGHPLFQDVKLHTSKSLATRGVSARSFRITGQIDLRRDLVWLEPGPVPSLAEVDRTYSEDTP